jgi:magnesium chelatase subunit I
VLRAASPLDNTIWLQVDHAPDAPDGRRLRVLTQRRAGWKQPLADAPWPGGERVVLALQRIGDYVVPRAGPEEGELADLLPEIDVVDKCPCNCAPGQRSSACLQQCLEGKKGAGARRRVPVVDLPLGATEDRIIGALNLERALAHGERVFEPGLLAMANRGFLYIDEVNLLEDHLVDLLLDAAASGENVVERDGLSVRHPARFVIVGSGNPEEGELRPQLLDRFGLSVEIHTPTDIAERIEVVRRRDAYERDPAAFAEAWQDAAAAVRNRITTAQGLLGEVDMPDAALEIATRLCLALGSDGLRGELSIMKAARATAALDERTTVEAQDIRTVAASALRHRLRRDPLDDTGSTARVERAVREILEDG